jgi:hypothetical protein
LLLGLGFTAGGATLATVTYVSGRTESITAGGGTLFKIGADWQINPSFALQGSAGYHADFLTRCSNCDLSFERNFVEGIGFWNFQPRHRIGLGLRQTSNAKVKSSGAASSVGNFDFSSSLGTVAEYEWLFAKTGPVGFGLTVRLVSEKYTDKTPGSATLGKSYDGSHAGVGVNFYF